MRQIVKVASLPHILRERLRRIPPEIHTLVIATSSNELHRLEEAEGYDAAGTRCYLIPEFEDASNVKGRGFERKVAHILDRTFYKQTQRHIRRQEFWEWRLFGGLGDLVFDDGTPLPFPIECKDRRRVKLSAPASWLDLIPRSGVLAFNDRASVVLVSFAIPEVLSGLPWSPLSVTRRGHRHAVAVATLDDNRESGTAYSTERRDRARPSAT